MHIVQIVSDLPLCAADIGIVNAITQQRPTVTKQTKKCFEEKLKNTAECIFAATSEAISTLGWTLWSLNEVKTILYLKRLATLNDHRCVCTT